MPANNSRDDDELEPIRNFLTQQYPYSAAIFSLPEEDHPVTFASFALDPENSDGGTSELPLQETYWVDDLDRQQLRLNLEEDENEKLIATMMDEETAISLVQQPSVVHDKEAEQDLSDASGSLLAQSSQTQIRAELETERYIKGGGRDDFVEFCLDNSAHRDGVVKLYRRANVDTAESLSESQGADVFEATIVDKSFRKRYFSGRSRSFKSFTLPDKTRVPFKDIAFGRWSVYHKVWLDTEQMTAHSRKEGSDLTIYSRQVKGTKHPDDFLSWYRDWNTDFKCKLYRSGVWVLAKNLSKYEKTLQGTCAVGFDTTNGLSSFLMDVPMEMTISLEPVMSSESDVSDKTKMTRPPPTRPKPPKTNSRYRPITTQSGDRPNDQATGVN